MTRNGSNGANGEQQEFSWETRSDGIAHKLDLQVGESFTGEFRGFVSVKIEQADGTIKPATWAEFREHGSDVLYSLSASYVIDKALRDVAIGSMVRLERLPDVDLGKPGRNPVKDYRVQVAAPLG